jgi:hypothetical protein
MFFDKISKAHCDQILSCSGPGAGIWFIIQLVFLAFQLFSLVSSTTLHMQLGLPHSSITNILWCVCTHPIDLMGIHLLCCVHGNEHIRTHDAICNTLTTIAQDTGFHVGQKQLHVLFQPHSTPFVDESTL